jgi:hypothetical protein
MRILKMNNSGFVAGTLIHTQTDLKPIEQIQVGDFVLSKSETGEQIYKRVVKTLQFENKAVYRIGYETEDTFGVHNLIVTGNHPFWVEGYDKEWQCHWDGESDVGWICADYLQVGAFIQLAGGELVRILWVDQLWRTSTDSVGWVEINRDADKGYIVDFREGQVQEDVNNTVFYEFLDDYGFLGRYDDEETAEDWACKCTVYNFEVEDFHTYFISELGVLVHDAIQQTS